jgi:hypothetical protein
MRCIPITDRNERALRKDLETWLSLALSEQDQLPHPVSLNPSKQQSTPNPVKRGKKAPQIVPNEYNRRLALLGYVYVIYFIEI